MKAHQLAAELLNGPNHEVFITHPRPQHYDHMDTIGDVQDNDTIQHYWHYNHTPTKIEPAIAHYDQHDQHNQNHGPTRITNPAIIIRTSQNNANIEEGITLIDEKQP